MLVMPLPLPLPLPLHFTALQPRVFRLPSRGFFVGPTHEYFEATPTAVQHDMDNIVTFAVSL
jgi:hypothetical protein